MSAEQPATAATSWWSRLLDIIWPPRCEDDDHEYGPADLMGGYAICRKCGLTDV